MKKAVENLGLNFLILSFLFIASAAKIPAQTCTPAPIGLVGWWEAENNALDSRSRNNGALQNGARFTAGHIGQAFDIDQNDDFVKIIAAPSLDVGAGDGFTLEAWINPGDNTSNPIFEYSSPTFPGVQLWMGVGPGGNNNLFANLIDTSDASHIIQTSPNLVLTGIFQHVALSYDKTTGEAKLYLNGVAVKQQNLGIFTPKTSVDLLLGGRITFLEENFGGKIDEPSVYNRVLSEAEIAAIHASGSAGKCKPTATVAPSGLIGWWAGDGNANDISGNNNNGVLNSNTFAVSRVGQGFDFISGAGITVADNAAFNQQNFTIEAWVTAQPFTCPLSCAQFIAARSGSNGFFGYEFGTTRNDGFLRFTLNGGAGGADLIDDLSINDGNFHHVAASYDGATMKIYLDGVLSAQRSVTTVINYEANSQFVIGRRQSQGASFPYNGLIDEVSLYNHPLTQAEIASIFNAGLAGKLKTATTATGVAEFDGKNSFTPEKVNTTVGDVTVTFPTVTTLGLTQQIPLEASDLPALPSGFTPTGLFYDIDTSAVFSDNPTLCFNLPSFSAQFSGLRVLHLENGEWTSVTAASNTFPNLCTTTINSFSPFAIAAAAPSASSVMIGGRVIDGKRGVANALVTITDAAGNRRYARTNPFGYYRFEEIQVGETYVFTVSHKRYVFTPQAVFIGKERYDLDFAVTP